MSRQGSPGREYGDNDFCQERSEMINEAVHLDHRMIYIHKYDLSLMPWRTLIIDTSNLGRQIMIVYRQREVPGT
jgi:hypothetical protein